MTKHTAQCLRWLKQLTSLPTAAGREQQVVGWVEQWVRRRPLVRLQRDGFGNLLLRSKRSSRKIKSPPIYITAHLDHPAFVVAQVHDARQVTAHFRGGVHAAYFAQARVQWHGRRTTTSRGTVRCADQVTELGDRVCEIQWDQPCPARVGDVLTWDLSAAHIQGDLLHAPACDDLAGVAAALCAFAPWLNPEPGHSAGKTSGGEVRVLLTRAEEVGFIGALAACESGLIAKNARLIALENSKSFADSPLGGGPILRIGDRTSSFDPQLTYQLGVIAQQLTQADEHAKHSAPHHGHLTRRVNREGEAPAELLLPQSHENQPAAQPFRWQRKLMPGGTCEASAYQALGFTATCLCLPLGNYHNMNQTTQQIDHEIIHVHDYLMLVRWLQAITRQLDDPQQTPTFAKRLSQLLASRRYLLED